MTRLDTQIVLVGKGLEARIVKVADLQKKNDRDERVLESLYARRDEIRREEGITRMEEMEEYDRKREVFAARRRPRPYRPRRL